MSILIEYIRISGFRGINKLEVPLALNTVLIGPNNSGKTSLLKALQLSIGDYSRYITDEDYYIDSNGKSVTEIIIDIKIVPLDENKRIANAFSDQWTEHFSTAIQGDTKQFVALRTSTKRSILKGHETERFILTTWMEHEKWAKNEIIKMRPATKRYESIPFISAEAQRDIHYELKDKNSFIGKILNNVKYTEKETQHLEKSISDINKNAVDRSAELTNLKTHLSHLNESIGGSGHAELTPLPKKIRDLAKNFSIQYGNDSTTFSMEYHGMGTRSWATLLTAKALINSQAANYASESKPHFPILAIEEPEAHLHPNAQKTLYTQLCDSHGQTFISTHSPYLAAMAKLENIRCLRMGKGGVTEHHFKYAIKPEERNILARDVLYKRSEILFSNAVLLCEGITEEQLLPSMYKILKRKFLHENGGACVSVGGPNYGPFIKIANSFGIPCQILSDNETSYSTALKSSIVNLEKEINKKFSEKELNIAYLSNGNDLEAELIQAGLKSEIIESLVLSAMDGNQNERYREIKTSELTKKTDAEILDLMRNSKASYSGFLAEVIIRNPNKKTPAQLVPEKVRLALENFSKWL